jgi:hypothetical protein
LEALAALVASDADLRASLPLGLDVADPKALASHVDSVRAALHAALNRVPVEAITQGMRRKVWDGGRPEPSRPVAGAAFADGLVPGDVVRVRIGLYCRPTRGNPLVLELPDRRVTFLDATRPALETPLSGGTPTVAFVSATAVARRTARTPVEHAPMSMKRSILVFRSATFPFGAFAPFSRQLVNVFPAGVGGLRNGTRKPHDRGWRAVPAALEVVPEAAAGVLMR